MCRILRSEWHQQARRFKEALFLRIHCNTAPSVAWKQWRECSRILDSSTEFLWQATLPQLRARLPRKPSRPRNVVHTVGDVHLPDDVHRVLSYGPKFAVEPKRTGPELLALVRSVADRAADSEREHCISEGVDVLNKSRPSRKRLPVSRAVTFLRDNHLSLVPADKEGGFTVLPLSDYQSRARFALDAAFIKQNNVNLAKVKRKAVKLCKNLNLEGLSKSIDNEKNMCLNVFFSAKTHKVDYPFRAIVSENGSWQKTLATFLQKKLRVLNIDDPFLVDSSDHVIQFLNSNPDKRFNAFSVDIKDLYYSLPHNKLMICIEDAIDQHGAVAFQNAAGIAASHLISLISFYLNSTFVSWEDDVFIQKNGVCIGSACAPVLSDIFLAFYNRILSTRLQGTRIVKIFRYVDDYLVILDCDADELSSCATQVLNVFRECLAPLDVTYEMPECESIRFLDLGLYFSVSHTCWSYEPRNMKPLLPYSSAHSKLVKRGIIKSSFRSALLKSCTHRTEESFRQQCTRLLAAGYPSHLLSAVAAAMLNADCRKNPEDTSAASQEKEKRKNVAVVPYIHAIAHNLKKTGKRADVNVVFSAPEKLVRLCSKVNSKDKKRRDCGIRHKNQFVACKEKVVYSLPLTCGKKYVGQSGRCVNDRLREHHNNVEKVVASGHLAFHCKQCSCKPLYDKCSLIGNGRDKTTREIVEALEILRLNDKCVSKASLTLSEKERKFLEDRH